MSVTVGVNSMSVIHKKSGGKSIAFPDVCKTPMPPGPVPIPYPNLSQSADLDKGAKTVKTDGCPLGLKTSNFKTSTGDEAGTAKGVASSKTKGISEFVNSSTNVKAEGKKVVRAMDLVLHNDKNTAPVPVIQPPLIVPPPVEIEKKCAICDRKLI